MFLFLSQLILLLEAVNSSRRLLDTLSPSYGDDSGKYNAIATSPKSATITSLCLRSGSRIDRIGAAWYSNNKVTGSYGGSGGKEYCFDLDTGACIVKVIGRSSASSGVHQLTFYDSKGKTYGPYGGNGGNRFIAQADITNYGTGCLNAMGLTTGAEVNSIFFRWTDPPQAPSYSFDFDGAWIPIISCADCEEGIGYTITTGVTTTESNSEENEMSTLISETNTEAWDTQFTVGAEAYGVSAEASVGFGVENSITQETAQRVARTWEYTVETYESSEITLDCVGGIVYQYIVRVDQLNKASGTSISYSINSYDFVCSEPGLSPKCAPGYCEPNTSCQTCVE